MYGDMDISLKKFIHSLDKKQMNQLRVYLESTDMCFRIRQLRREKGLTMDQVVELSGGKITKSQLSLWENGKTKPYPANVKKLADVYGVSTKKIYGG